MKNTGVWLDRDKAIVVTLNNGREVLEIINSEIEDFKATSSRLLGGHQEIAKDRKFLEREKHQFKNYFKNIVIKIKDADAIALFGPAQTNEKFNKVLHELYPDVAKKIKGVEKADSMTDNQVIALVKEFFNSK